MAGIGIDFILKATTEGFTAGLAKANAALKDVKHELHSFGAPRSLSHAFGLIGIIEAFKLTIEHAQKTREEFEKLGKPLDDATRSVAEFGDGIKALVSGTGDLAIGFLSFFTRAGEGYGMVINRMRGISREQEKLNEETGRAADEQEKKLKKLREENAAKVEAGERRLADIREKAATDRMTGEEKINALVEQQKELLELVNNTGEHSVKGLEARIKLEENVTALGKARNEQEKQLAEQEKQLAEQEKKMGEEDAKWYREKVKLEKELHDLKFKSLAPEQQLIQLAKEELAIRAKLRKDKLDGVDTTQDEIDLQKNLNQQEEIRAALVKKTAQSEADIVAAKKKAMEDEKNSHASIVGVRGLAQFGDASDAALEQVSRINRAKAQGIRGNAGNQGLAQSLEAARLEAEAMNAERELGFRRNLRRDFALGGEAGARRSFQGDPLAFDKLYSQYVKGQTTAEASLQVNKDVLAILKRGIPTVPLKPGTG